MMDYENLPSVISSKLQRALYGEGDIQWEEEPWLNFPEWMEVKIVFPFGGAAARFRVRDKANPDKEISVYYDVKDQLGYVGKPYFGIYPSSVGEPERFLARESNKLVTAIGEALRP